jgi:hypothetical protein
MAEILKNDKLSALLGSRPEIMSRIKVLDRVTRKLGDTMGMVGSPTAKLLEEGRSTGEEAIKLSREQIQELIEKAPQKLSARAIHFGLSALGQVSTPKALAKMLTDPKSLDLMIKVMNPNYFLSAKEAARILTQISAININNEVKQIAYPEDTWNAHTGDQQ